MIFVPPHGLELRGGLDFSLAGEDVTPLLDVYIAQLPWERVVGVDDGNPSSWFTISDVSRARTEWHLSIPIGVELRESSQGSRPTRLVFALIPEITLASSSWANRQATTDVAVRQWFALFLAARFEAEP